MSSEGFDLRTTIRDPKTGEVKNDQPYRLKIGAEGRRFERPPGSGRFYDEGGTLIRDEQAEKAKVDAARAAEAHAKEALQSKDSKHSEKAPELSLADAEKNAMESVNAVAKAKASEKK